MNNLLPWDYTDKQSGVLAEIDDTKQLKNVVGWFPRNSETEISKQEMCEGVVSVLTPVGKGGGGAELACG